MHFRVLVQCFAMVSMQPLSNDHSHGETLMVLVHEGGGLCFCVGMQGPVLRLQGLGGPQRDQQGALIILRLPLVCSARVWARILRGGRQGSGSLVSALGAPQQGHAFCGACLRRRQTPLHSRQRGASVRSCPAWLCFRIQPPLGTLLPCLIVAWLGV